MIDFAPVARFGLLLIRPGMLVLVSPVLGGTAAPAPVKIGLTILLALGLAPVAWPVVPVGEVTLSIVVARELAIGLALAFVVQALVAGAEFAGHLAGQQIGFSYGATIDPASGVRNTMIASLYGMLTLLTFLGINGHHAVLRALAASYQGLPIGAGHVNESIVEAVRATLGLVFTLGLRLAAPVIVVLLLVETVVGLISRTAPALNFQVLGYAVRVVVGLAIVAASIGLIPGVVGSLVDSLMSLSLRAAAAFK